MYRCEFAPYSLDEGILVDGTLMDAIGIRHDSQCWATIVDSSYSLDSAIPPLHHIGHDDYNVHAQAPHVIVSPIPHDLWPSTARVSLVLSDDKGSVATALDLISRRANIQLFTITPIGYKTAELRMILSFPNFDSWVRKRLRCLREQLDDIRSQSDGISDNAADKISTTADSASKAMHKGRVNTFTEISTYLNALLSCLVADIIRADAALPPRDRFLSPKYMAASTRPWFGDYKQITRTKYLLNKLFDAETGYAIGPESASQDQSQSRISDRLEVTSIFQQLDELVSRPHDAYQVDHSFPDRPRTIGSSREDTASSESEDYFQHLRWREQFFFRTWRDSWTSAVTAAPLSYLAYARIWSFAGRHISMIRSLSTTEQPVLTCMSDAGGAGDMTALEKLLDMARQSLSPVDADAAPTQRAIEWERSHIVIDSDGPWLRMRMMQKGFADLYGIRIDITAEAHRADKLLAAVNTQGLLAHVCGTIDGHGGNIINAHSTILPSATEAKRVGLTMFVVVAQADRTRASLASGSTRQEVQNDWQKTLIQALEVFRRGRKSDTHIVSPEVRVTPW